MSAKGLHESLCGDKLTGIGAANVSKVAIIAKIAKVRESFIAVKACGIHDLMKHGDSSYIKGKAPD